MTKFAEPSGDSVIYDRLVIGQSWQPNTPVDYGLYQGNHLIRCHSLEDLSQRLANCHSGIASVTFANIVIDDAFLTFLRSVDPKCFGGRCNFCFSITTYKFSVRSSAGRADGAAYW